MKDILKIVHIISNLSQGGAQVLLLDIVKILKKKPDCDITVITIDSGEYTDKFRDAGIEVIDLEEKGLINFSIYKKIKKILKRLNPDIVHTHLNKADFYGRLAAKNTGVSVIFSTCHNYSTTHKGADIDKKSIFDIIDNLVAKYTDSKLIAISYLVKKYLINRDRSLGLRTQVIYNGIDMEKQRTVLTQNERYEMHKKFKIDDKTFVIGIIGRLEKQKGHLFFINAVKDFMKKNPNIKILILGDGSQRKDIELLIKENSLEERIILTGFVEDSEPYIELCDMICVPSLWEGFGLVILESMIKRKIVLASNVGGIVEIITDGETGFLFRSESKESLVEKLDFIYTNFKKLDHIKENSMKLVKDKFDIKLSAESYNKAYEENFPLKNNY